MKPKMSKSLSIYYIKACEGKKNRKGSIGSEASDIFSIRLSIKFKYFT